MHEKIASLPFVLQNHIHEYNADHRERMKAVLYDIVYVRCDYCWKDAKRTEFYKHSLAFNEYNYCNMECSYMDHFESSRVY